MQNIYATLKYDDAHAAIDFLEKAFGFNRHAVYDGENGGVAHAELRFGSEMVMLGSSGEGDAQFDEAQGHSSLYLVVDDPDAHHNRARKAGAEIVRGLRDEDYGSRGYTARDTERNLWSFGTYRPR